MASSTSDQQQQSSRLTGKLVLVEGGDDVPRNILLYDKDIIVGRGCGCNVTLGSLQISRRHATLEYVNNKWFIRDASTNGISVGTRDPDTPGAFVSSRLVKGVLQELKDRDLIHLIPTGSLIYRFELHENQPQPTGSAQQIKTDNAPEVVTVDDDLVGAIADDSSNESQSLLSISGHVEECVQSFQNSIEGQDEDDYLSDLNPGASKPLSKEKAVLGKRKPTELSEVDRDLNGQLEKKRKRRSREECIIMDVDYVKDNERNNAGDRVDPGDYSSDEDNISPSAIENCFDLNTLKSKCLKLCAKFQKVQTVAATLRLEKKIDREEYLQKQNDVQSRTEAYKEELFKKIVEVMEHEFSCCICNEVFVAPTVVDCGHTFCNFCIHEWARKKPECPICRKYIRSQTKHVEMDNYITKLHTLLSEEIKLKRDNLVAERKVEKEKAAVKAAAESRGRRGAVPNGDFPGYAFPQASSAFDLLQELQNINDHSNWAPPPAHIGNSNATSANAAAQRRSSRIQTRNQPAGDIGPRAQPTARRGGVDRQRYGTLRGLRGFNMDMLGGLNPLDDVLREYEALPRGPPPNNASGGPNPQQPQPGVYGFAPGNGAMPVPNFLENPRHSFFPMFPFGGMGRHENRPQPGVPVGPPPPSSGNNSVGSLLEVLNVD